MLIPEVNFITTKSVGKSVSQQEVKFNQLSAGVRINASEIDKQINQYSQRENLPVSGILENEGEDVFEL